MPDEARAAMPRTKIVCTIGPASRAPATLERLVQAGMSVARLNLSHGSQAEHRQVIDALRAIGAQLGRPVAILLDLAGLKVRIREIEAGAVTLEPGAAFTLTTRPVPGSAREVSIAYPGVVETVRPGDPLLLSDGDLELEVIEATEDAIRCRVVVGGILRSRKGVSLPTRSVSGPSLTEKDRQDLAFGVRHGVDYVALSFVRTAADVDEARRVAASLGADVPVIAKIEKHEALGHLDEIVAAVDGVMVARGDLGVEIPLARVPTVQKLLIGKANQAGKPVITATHMLRSMVDSPRPTRAEVADVANAVLDGTDAVMLSEETAIGRFPVEAVQIMAEIIAAAEADLPLEAWRERLKGSRDGAEAIARAAGVLAEDLPASAIVTCTDSGTTARLVAKYRPQPPILASTPRSETYRRLALVWGVTPLRGVDAGAIDELVERALAAALASGRVQPGQTVVVMAGLGPGRATSVIRVESLRSTASRP